MLVAGGGTIPSGSPLSSSGSAYGHSPHVYQQHILDQVSSPRQPAQVSLHEGAVVHPQNVITSQQVLQSLRGPAPLQQGGPLPHQGGPPPMMGSQQQFRMQPTGVPVSGPGVVPLGSVPGAVLPVSGPHLVGVPVSGPGVVLPGSGPGAVLPPGSGPGAVLPPGSGPGAVIRGPPMVNRGPLPPGVFPGTSYAHMLHEWCWQHRLPRPQYQLFPNQKTVSLNVHRNC